MCRWLPTLWPNQWRVSTLWPGDSRHLVRRSLLRILALAHDQRLDVAVLVRNLAMEHRGTNRRLLLRLARRIDRGLPLVAALEQTPEVLGEHQVLAIRFGSQSGTLTTTYHYLINEGEMQHSTASRDFASSFLYLAAMAVAMILTISFLFAFVFPTFHQVEKEFELDDPLPAYAFVSWVYQQTGFVTLLVSVMVLIAFPLLWMGSLGRWLRRQFADSRLHWVEQFRVAELMELLAQSVAAGRPLSGALSTLARYHFDKHIRLRLLFARNEVEQGAEVGESFHTCGLLSIAEAQALSASSSPASQAWLMRRLASRKREQGVVFAEAAAQTLRSIIVILIAAVVLLLSGAVYQYLAGLIYELS